MNKITLFIFITLQLNTFSQITIESIDLPQPGQDYYRSTSNNPTIDLTQTGQNFIWDYTNLQPDTRDTMMYHSVSQTPVFYQFLFNNPLDQPYKSTEARKTSDVNIGGFLDMTNNYLFSKNSATEWTEVGIGTTVAGAPIPTKYSDIKIKLNLPLNYLDTHSDDYSYLLTIPTFGAQGQDGTLTYTVDGWGILKTPGGSFQVLRVKTEVVKSDTIFINQLNFGLRIPSNETVYEWYAENEGYPILTVTEQAGRITSAVFTDNLSVGIKTYEVLNQNSVYPNPASSVLNLQLNSVNLNVSIVDISGRIVLQHEKLSPTQVNISDLPNGLYFIKLDNPKTHQVLRFVKQ
jgi:hypothetical protein